MMHKGTQNSSGITITILTMDFLSIKVVILAGIMNQIHAECPFRIFPRTVLYGFNDKTIQNIDRWECGRQCTQEQEFQCRSYDYLNTTSACFLSQDSCHSQPGAYGKHAMADHYERACGDEDKAECLEGWVTSTDSCYLMKLKEPRSWHDANTICSGTYDAHLVVINDEAEFNFVTSEIDKEFTNFIWTAGRQEGNDWVWKLNNGVTVPMQYTNWYPGEPNDDLGVDEDYVNLMKIYGSWGFNDAPNYPRRGYICEMAR